MIFKSRFRAASILFLVMGQFTLAQTANALVPKQDESSLESLAFVSEILRASPRSVPFDEVRGQDAAGIANAWDGFRKGHGDWNAIVDKRTGKLEIAEGEGIPFVPGRGNKLQMPDISSDSVEGKEPDLADLEAIARAFLPDVADMLGVDPATLVLNRGRSGHPADYLWFIDFDVILDGMAVEGARVVFRVNNGNLIQFGSEYLPAEGIHTPKGRMTRNQALSVLASYIGGFSAADSFSDGGSQLLIPVALPNNQFPDGFERGKGRGLARVWQFIFRRDGDYGTWRARIDATSGKLLEFRDVNDYVSAQVAGGVKSLTGTETRPMPFADVSSGGYTNSAGVYDYTGGTVSSYLDGEYVKIEDTCGSISMTSDTGNLGFGTSTGTEDCNTPGFGGAGNTRASRTQFYAINRAKEIARGWLNLLWLNAQLTAKVNRTDYNGDGICNAFWDGTTLNLYQKSTSCSNSGEIQGVGLHEFGHGLDANDGNGPSLDKGTGETYGDWTATLFTHDSCIGDGLLTSTCDGYGDPCTSCTGVRDIDYAKHASNTPHTVSNFTQSRCPAGNGYIGPCGRKGHCESYVSSEALWDLVARDLPNAGIASASAWAIMDRLWYLSRSTATAAFTCYNENSPWTSDGCLAGSLWTTMRAVDDDDGNLSNGTPHSAALYAAFNRHGIACPLDAGASTSFRGCAQPTAPTLSLAAANNQVTLSWAGPTGVYDIYRNEQGCGASFIKVANDLTSPQFVDTDVANDFTYFYQVIAQPNGNEGCASAPSSCLEALPCKPPTPPANLAATSVSASQIDLSWSSSSGATRYHIYRATTPNGPYTRIGSRSGNTYSDTDLSSCTTYYYVVRAAGNATCESGNSIQLAATTTGSCPLNLSVTGGGAWAWVQSSGIYCDEYSPSCSITYPYNTVVTLSAIVGNQFTEFLGWSEACTGTNTQCTVTMTQARSVKARFSEISPFTVSGGDLGIVTSTPAGIQCGFAGDWEWECEASYPPGTSVTLTAVPWDGYIFTGWEDWASPSSPLCTGTGTCTVTMPSISRKFFFYAGFRPAETLTTSFNGPGTGMITSSPAGINCGTDCSEMYSNDTWVTLTATPATGSNFSGWSGACTGTGACTVSMGESRSVTATFSVATYTLTDFYTIPFPCRVFDSRTTGPWLTSGVPLIINIAGNCGVPATAKAVSLNVTALAAPGDGFITLYPGDITLPGTWTIGFPASLNRANNAIIPLALNGNGTLGAVAVITGGGNMPMALDVNGYFE